MRTQKNSAMSKFYKVLSIIVLALMATVVSCSQDDGPDTIPLRDYQEQYQKDIDTIDYFLDHYKMEVSPDFDVTFSKITVENQGTSIRNQTDYPLNFKEVTVAAHGDFTYKIYYISFREGANQAPSAVDSVYIGYKGVRIDAKNDPTVFDQSPATWIPTAVRGMQEIIPFFKTGFYTSGGGPDPVSFSDFGAGVMFIPSGLGYFSQVAGSLPSYSPMVMSFKLFELNYSDHDRDGILSKDETDPEHPETSVIEVDTDGDGVINMLDIDDDGDGILTKHEIHFDAGNNLIFEDCDSDGVPNYLDPDSNGQTCN